MLNVVFFLVPQAECHDMGNYRSNPMLFFVFPLQGMQSRWPGKEGKGTYVSVLFQATCPFNNGKVTYQWFKKSGLLEGI